MKILLFEYVTGGGMAREELPPSLAREGELMLTTLVSELGLIIDAQLTILLDWRFKDLQFPQKVEIIWVSTEQSIYDLLPPLIQAADFIWPIAPEIDLILQNISKLVEVKNHRSLNSSSDAVTLCSDKLMIFQLLKNHGIDTVATLQFDSFSKQCSKQYVVKPRFGVGCDNTYLVTNDNEFLQLEQQIDNKSKYIIQPYVKGELLSLSCLFKERKAWLLCCNRQLVSVNRGQFMLNACVVNIAEKKLENFQHLINQMADIIPGLWGYVGIDIIQSEADQFLVLDINPRLTTSYVGIYHALGVNVAKTVLSMIETDPEIIKTINKQITITLN